MPQRKPRLISKAVEVAAERKRADVQYPPPSSIPLPAPQPKTELDRIYDLIDEACAYCNRFTDEDGRPWIGKEDIEDQGYGIYCIRFRCSVDAMRSRASFDAVAEEVCGKLNAKVRYVCKVKEEKYSKDIKLFYEDCVWVVKVGELDQEPEDADEDDPYESCIDTQEEIKGELVDESTAEEVDERIDQAMDNFL